MEKEQIERIHTMEQNLDGAVLAVKQLDTALEAYEAILPGLKRLMEYYEGAQWRKDYEDDEAGKLPADLKRGVLSEDAVYNLLCDVRELRERMTVLGKAEQSMTYEEAKCYLEKVSQTGSILGLENIQNLMQELGNVQEQLKIIHIAGTNGKGSVGAFLESVLLEAGYRVGRYTSPAVFEAFEVWRINGKNISLEDYLACLSQVKAACEKMLEKGMEQPTVFEVETALAFVYFAAQNCDYVLLEVGMGGETDATNLITSPLCSVITSISRDHMQFLGNSLAEIAAVKAGIIKKNCPVVTCDTQKPEVLRTIEQKAAEKSAELILAKTETISEVAWDILKEANEKKKSEQISSVLRYHHAKLGQVELSLTGAYQIENSNLAAAVCTEVLGLEPKTIRRGLKNAVWQGRFELIAKQPLIILDGAHNEDAAKKLAQSLQKYFTNRRILYIIGVLADKEHQKILEQLLPLTERVYTVTPPNARALSGAVLAEEIKSFGKEAVFCEEIEQAARLALQAAKQEDVIVAFGSLSYLAELKKAVGQIRNVW